MDTETIMYLAQDVILGILVIVSLAITIVAFLSYNRTKSRRIMLVAIAFGFVFIKILVLTYTIYNNILDVHHDNTIYLDFILVTELLGLVFIYSAIFR